MPIENILYLGGPNIASEIYNKEYANARICGAEKWRKPLANFLRQPQFIVWDNSDLVTHEVMGGLKMSMPLEQASGRYFLVNYLNDMEITSLYLCLLFWNCDFILLIIKEYF